MLNMNASHLCSPYLLPMYAPHGCILPAYAPHECIHSPCLFPIVCTPCMYASKCSLNVYVTHVCLHICYPAVHDTHAPYIDPMYAPHVQYTLTLLCMLPMHEKMRGGMQMYGKVLPCSICYSGFLCISPMYASHGYSRACSPIPMYGKMRGDMQMYGKGSYTGKYVKAGRDYGMEVCEGLKGTRSRATVTRAGDVWGREAVADPGGAYPVMAPHWQIDDLFCLSPENNDKSTSWICSSM
jgi:hypothetical protein